MLTQETASSKGSKLNGLSCLRFRKKPSMARGWWVRRSVEDEVGDIIRHGPDYEF